MLVGKHGYTCGFFSLVSLFISDIQGMTGYCIHMMLIRVLDSVNNHRVPRSVFEEASMKMGIKSVLKTYCVTIKHI